MASFVSRKLRAERDVEFVYLHTFTIDERTATVGAVFAVYQRLSDEHVVLVVEALGCRTRRFGGAESPGCFVRGVVVAERDV